MGRCRGTVQTSERQQYGRKGDAEPPLIVFDCNAFVIRQIDSGCCFENQDDAKFNKFLVSLQVHFWSLFGYSDNYADWFQLRCSDGEADRSATAVVGEITFALYHVGTVLVLVNMLIAIMSGTLQKTTDESDIQWQFHRTRVGCPFYGLEIVRLLFFFS